MASCPQCQARVGWRAIFFPSALAGIVCPACHASLEPEPWRYAVLNVLAMLAGSGVFQSLQLRGLGLILRLFGFFATYLLVIWLLQDFLVRLRMRRPTVLSIR